MGTFCLQLEVFYNGKKRTFSTEMCRQTQGHVSQTEDILLVNKINVLAQPGHQNHSMAEVGRDV